MGPKWVQSGSEVGPKWVRSQPHLLTHKVVVKIFESVKGYQLRGLDKDDADRIEWNRLQKQRESIQSQSCQNSGSLEALVGRATKNVADLLKLWRKYNKTGIEHVADVATKEDLVVNHHMNVLISAAVALNQALDDRTGRVDDAMAGVNHTV